MSFTDQKPRIATKKDIETHWSGRPNNEGFRCGLCGYKFKEGDYWRWVYAGPIAMTNFMTCELCDGPNVLRQWKLHYQEAKERFWYFIED